MELVKIRQPSANRWALWAFAMALLLKAAMPLLAAASAELQGKTLVEEEPRPTPSDRLRRHPTRPEKQRLIRYRACSR